MAIQRRYGDGGPVTTSIGVQRSPITDRGLPALQQMAALVSDAIQTENEHDPWTALAESLSAKHKAARERDAELLKYDRMLESQERQSEAQTKNILDTVRAVTGKDKDEKKKGDDKKWTDISSQHLYGMAGPKRKSFVLGLARQLLKNPDFQDVEYGEEQSRVEGQSAPGEGWELRGTTGVGKDLQRWYAKRKSGRPYEERVADRRFVKGLEHLLERGLAYQAFNFAEELFPGQGQDALDRAFKSKGFKSHGFKSNWASRFPTEGDAVLAEDKLQRAALARMRQKDRHFLMEPSHVISESDTHTRTRETSETAKARKRESQLAEVLGAPQPPEEAVDDEDETGVMMRLLRGVGRGARYIFNP